MPNRTELPNPAMRRRSAAKSDTVAPDSGAWTIIAVCAIGYLLSFYVAVSSVGIDAFQQLMGQIPWG
jgi:hypothetical protein